MKSERQKIKQEIYKTLKDKPLDKEKLTGLNAVIEYFPPKIEDTKRYNFKTRQYVRKSI